MSRPRRMWVVVLLAAAAGVLLGAAARRTATYADPYFGFTLAAPAFPGGDSVPAVIPVMMFGPSQGGFSSNVNVTVQRRKTTRDAYHTQMLAEFKAAGLTLNATRNVTVSGKDAIQMDYQGTMGGRALRWLVLAVIDTDRVLLVTCTCPQERFAEHKAAFEACLASFRLTGGKP